ncbi:GntR family transcriptional regulator [Paraburkholderia caribensis]|uniref:Transcriptional regulator, GntR family n=2 Tax=Paraburkholderia TaxID=1822464 RepID=B2JYG4_PARP8|nr:MULTISPECIES: GntR family transcriptional regulator [Paraburkholderia]ACC76672.1 transcriptional regulator, GntR family [Paraburkholderia phymatum STM815]MCO4882300.1 GntR family transcriptional regulator [Paraburkholderia caribensis]PTB24426.1 GntR family transcriptional regulator [Paraburkholderia caribensis]
MARVVKLKGQALRPTSKAPAVRGQTADIYRTLRDRICSLHYPPGTLLGETVLAEEFEVSRTPIRQVLQRLEYEGLVETKNGVGTIVSGVDFREYRDTYNFRLRLSEMLGDFCSPTDAPQALERIERLVPRAAALSNTSRNFDEFWAILHELHFAINELIRNRELRQTHDRCYFQASRVWYNFVSDLWEEEVEYLNHELEECCRALRAADMRALGLVQRNYISFGLARIARFITG